MTPSSCNCTSLIEKKEDDLSPLTSLGAERAALLRNLWDLILVSSLQEREREREREGSS